MKTIRIKSLMAALFAVVILIVNFIASPPAQAASFNEGYGMNNRDDSAVFTMTGVSNAVITSVLSNAMWVATGTRSSGAPVYDETLFRNDLLAGTIRYYIGTNSWICASNSSISGGSSNIIWLTTTNTGMATNDILIAVNSDDTVGLAVVSGNATDSTGLAYTNAQGQVGIKLFSGFGMTLGTDTTIWKMAQVQTWTPLAIQSLTNSILSVTNLAQTNIYWPLSLYPPSGERITFSGKIGTPTAAIMTFNGSADLRVRGRYVRTRP